MFNFDWFHHGGLDRLVEEAKGRCAAKKFPERADGNGTAEFEEYRDHLDTRVIIYLKDGLTYEMKEIADVGMSSALTFEAVPMDENYKVGSIVLMVPFEDIARVEVFAVHPDDKPQENIRIPGFQAAAAGGGRE